MQKWFTLCAIFMLPSLILAGNIEYSINVNPADIKIEKFNNYDKISLSGFDYIVEPGHPALPAKVFSFVIPPDAKFEDIELVNEDADYLSGTFNIFPAQRPVPISFSTGNEFTQPDERVYSLNTLYPDGPVKFIHEGNLSGYHIVSVFVTPLRYNPALKKVYFAKYLSFRIKYQNGANIVKTISPAQMKLGEKRVKTMVVNKDQVITYAPLLARNMWQTEYFIITDQSFVDAFRPLKAWKTLRGVPTEIVTTSWIYGNYAGNDNPDRVRNFIKEAADSGALYFLLGGQCDFEHGEDYVPRRDTWFYDFPVGGYVDEDTIPCDLYYSDLDRNWNNDGDNIYGELGDWVDMYSDVYVGRAPVKNTAQISNFVSKVITYESSPSPVFIEKILLPVGNLWTGNHGNGINDTIADTIPDYWQKSKLYQDYGLINQTIVRDSINKGFNLSHMVGHGNENGVYYGYGSTAYYDGADPSTQTNDSTNALIALSQACFSGAVDKNGSGNDCLAERMINVNKNCATAVVMNTRYGWGYSSPEGTLGPSGELDVWFFRKLFGTSAYHIGEVLAYAKDQKVPFGGNQYWRACLFEFTLFGDPEMPIWTDSLKNLIVSMPDTIKEDFTVTVLYSGAPVENALVIIMQDSTGYYRVLTDGSGHAIFDFGGTAFQHQGIARVTVTKYDGNFLPYLDSAYVAPQINVEESPTPDHGIFDVKISPNPITKMINLSLGAPVKNETVIKIYDVRGRLVKSIKLNKGITNLSVSIIDLNSGIYFLKAQGALTIDEKVIIVK